MIPNALCINRLWSQSVAALMRCLDSGLHLCQHHAACCLTQDFPYNFVEGIEHHVLWCSEPMSEAEVAQHIAQRFPGKATCHWVNPVELQSVLAVGCCAADCAVITLLWSVHFDHHGL